MLCRRGGFVGHYLCDDRGCRIRERDQLAVRHYNAQLLRPLGTDESQAYASLRETMQSAG